MAEQVDINISTIVDDAQLISLKEELVELMDKVFDIVIDASSADEASDSVDNLADSMDDLSDKSSESLDSVDNLSDSMDNLSDKSAQASDGVKDFSDSQEEATKSTDMLTGALSTLAALGIVEFFKSAAESAAGFERSMNVLSIVSEEAGVSLDATKKTASGLTSEFGLSGGSVRSFVSELTMLGIESQEVIKGLGKSATGVGYLLGDSFDTVNAKIKNAIIKGKIIPKQFGSAFTMIKNSVEESGQSFEEWESKFDSATEPERAIMLNDVLRDTKSIQEAAAKSAQSFDAKMQRLDNTIGGIIRRLGEPALAAFAPIIDGIAWAVGGLVDIWDGLPRPMKDFISGIILVVGAVGGFVAVITAVAAIMPAIIGALGALAGASGAVTLSSIAASLGLSGLGAALMPILGALAPVIGIALAIVGIAIAIQELGKYMGWWEDWGTMIESFQAGISRLWSAFTNNSQVIAFIDNIKSDWASLMEILSPIGEALTNFWNDLFPDNAADEGFDIVRAIIDVFGLLGDAVASVWGFFTENPIGKFIATLLLILNPITLVILWFDELVATFQAVSNFLSNVGGKILDALNTIASFFMNLWSKVTGFFLSSFYDETGKWLGVIPGILNLLFKIGKTILKGILAIPGLILTGLTKLYNIGVSIGESIYNGLSQIPGMIIRAFSNISSWILSALSSAASSTSSAAGSVDWSRILTSLIDFITSIPGQIMSLAKSVFSGGIDVMGAIAGALFGSTGEVNFKSNANKLLNVLFNPSEWSNLIATGINKVVATILGFGPVQMIIDSIFGDGATIGLTAAITNFVSQLALLPEMLLTYLMTGLSIIWNWGVQIVTAGFTIASQFLTSIFTFVSQLPTQLWKLFLSGLNYILIFGVNAAARAATAGQGILNGVMGFVKTIPEKVYQEFVRIGEKILSVGGDLYNKAKNVAQNIWDGMNSIFQMSSPGMMFHMISAEVDRIVGVFSSNTLNAFRSAQDLGKGIFSGFNHGIDINNLGNVMINGSIEPYDYSSDYRIEYPSNDKYVLEINSVIAEASVVDTFEYYVDKVKERNRMRS